jgi:hypothetical protein
LNGKSRSFKKGYLQILGAAHVTFRTEFCFASRSKKDQARQSGIASNSLWRRLRLLENLGQHHNKRFLGQVHYIHFPIVGNCRMHV